MPRVRIVHWRADEAKALIDACRASGFDVEYDDVQYPVLVRMLRASPPDALLIDLTRLPSHGRDIALALRRSREMRNTPLVFVDGDPEKVDAIRRQLPDATFAARKQLASRLRAACKQQVVNPVVPPPPMAQYASRTVAQKLGIREGSMVALIDPPRNYSVVIGDLPPNVELDEDPTEAHRITLWFVSDPVDYRSKVRRMRALAARTKLWVIWRKGLTNGLTQFLVRDVANEAGLVDYKICALHEQWSGMAFSPRKS